MRVRFRFLLPALLLFLVGFLSTTLSVQAMPASGPNCITKVCQAIQNWGGVYPNDASLGVSASIVQGHCDFSTGCITTSGGFVDEYVQDTTAGHDGAKISIGYESYSGGGTQAICTGFGQGNFWFFTVLDSNGSNIEKNCYRADPSFDGDFFQVQENWCYSCFSGEGGEAFWILAPNQNNTGLICNPCEVSKLDGAEQTFYKTQNIFVYHDSGSSLNIPVDGAAWQNNQFQQTNGAWHYQTSIGSMSITGGTPPVYMWWVFTPPQSTTGGWLDACISVNNPSGC